MKLHHLAALVALTAPATSGCMFLEVNGGYYPSTSYDAPGGASVPDSAKPSASWGLGLGVGFYLEVAETVRVAPGANLHYMPLSNDDDGSGSWTATGVGGQIDVSVLELEPDEKLRATGAFYTGGGGVTFDPGTGEQDAEGVSTTQVFLGATYAMFDNETDTIQISLGPQYIKTTTDDAGDLSALGVHLKLTISADLFADSGGGGGGGGGGGSGRIEGIKFDLPGTTNVIPALSQGARNAGCSVSEKSDGLGAECSEGNIVYVQKGSTLVALCQKGMSKSQCRSLHSRILSNTPVGR